MTTARATVLVLSSIVFLALPGRAAAQDRGDTGISMGYPGSIGFVFHVSDRFALRPEVSFVRTSSERDSLFGDSISTGTTYEVGVSGLVYVGQWDKVRAYVSPGYSYRHFDSSVDSDDLPLLSTSTFAGHTVKGSFGAQYSLHQRLSVFGEAGLSYATQELKSNFSTDETNTRSLNTRTAVGVVFYF